jgi:subtilisin family serine protease
VLLTPSVAQARAVEVVVSLRQPGLAAAAKAQRSLAALTSSRGRIDLASPVSVSYVQQLRREQARVAARIERAIPGARVRWHYTITFDGLAVVVPARAADRLAAVDGVTRVWPSARFHSQLDRTPELIGAPQLWGPTLATAGQGVKIGIIDEGVDQTHPFLSPAGFTMPPGYPKGNTSFTTAKVIVARAFPPPSPKWKYANLPFDPQFSEHGTHVAGIAAGDHGTRAVGFAGTPTVSGIAPAAYIGNYKALTIPTPGFGLDGNAAEIAKAIEAAVADGMDVINLSLGEPEIAPSRDIVVKAIDGAAAAGVVPVIAAGNDFEDFGRGSISSPGNAPDAITAAASTTGRGGPADRIASFSSGGPTPISLEMKPDATAPGVDVLSSVPAREGSWALFSGTSMATPHIAGSAALLRQRHPSWTVAQIKSALEQTGDPVQQGGAAANAETSPMREGGGRIDLPRADNPLLFASPTGVSFGMLVPPADAQRTIALTDAGGGAGTWNVSVTQPLVSAPTTVSVPGQLVLRVNVAAGAAESEASGFVVLTRGSDVRRIPWWVGVSHPSLPRPVRTLTRTGTYKGNAAKGSSRAADYRYPEPDLAPLNGPEEVFAVHVGTVANFGARVVSHAAGVAVTPRIVLGDDQNRLAGYTALPFDFNPYRSLFGRSLPAAGVVLPTAGIYGLVFDTPSRAQAGPFTFRLWVNDVTPPKIRFRSYNRGTIRIAVSDAGSGVDPRSISVSVDSSHPTPSFRNGVVTVREGLAPGKHRLLVTASDFQEAKNMEDVVRILPNTRTYSKTLVVR